MLACEILWVLAQWRAATLYGISCIELSPLKSIILIRKFIRMGIDLQRFNLDKTIGIECYSFIPSRREVSISSNRFIQFLCQYTYEAIEAVLNESISTHWISIILKHTISRNSLADRNSVAASYWVWISRWRRLEPIALIPTVMKA